MKLKLTTTLLAVLIAIPFLGSAQVVQKKTATSNKASLKVKAASAADMKAKEKAKAEPKVIQGKSIEFVDNVHEFGKVEPGTMVEYTFEFVNNGTEDIKISNIKTSCGCTAAKYSKGKIAPGSMGFVKAKFDTKNKGGLQFKTLTVVYGGDKPAILYLKGEVNNTAGETDGKI